MRRGLGLAVMFVAACSMMGCKKQVPNDIVQQSLRGALSTHAPKTTSAMCGTSVRGLLGATVTVKSKTPENVGVAHVRGMPVGAIASKTPAFCEGDVEFKFSSTSRTTGYKRSRKTTTTWYLDHVKLIAIQTPGVTGGTADETPDGDDDDN